MVIAETQEIENPEIHFSVGMVMSKSNIPVPRLGDLAEEALEKSKSIDKGEKVSTAEGKNAVTIFNRSVKWADWKQLCDLEEEIHRLVETYKISTSYLYSLIRLCEQAADEKNIESTMWRSRFYYRTVRYVTDKLPKVSKNNARQDVLYYAKEGLTQLMAFNKVTPSTVLCKKSVMDEVGGFTWHKKAEDLHCWLKVLFAGYKIYRIDETLLLYRLVENSMSSTDRNCSKEVFEIIYRFKDEILSLDIDLQIYINHWLRKYVFYRMK